MITPNEVRYGFDFEPEIFETISLDDWEDCLRRFDAWMNTIKFRAD